MTYENAAAFLTMANMGFRFNGRILQLGRRRGSLCHLVRGAVISPLFFTISATDFQRNNISSLKIVRPTLQVGEISTEEYWEIN